MIQGMQQPNNIFISTISCLKNKTTINDLLSDFKDQLRFKNLKRTTLNPENLLKKYSMLQRKYQRGTLAHCPQGWHQNERKLFLSFYMTYCHLHFKKATEISQKEWREFSQCFHQKSPLLLRYEAASLQRNSQRVHWSTSEENLLKNCINSSLNGKWAEISKTLFNLSQGEFFKTAKQCREHWFNHMNTDIKKGGWTIDEDLMILNFVLTEGRHWSRLIQEMGRVRTEHMVKNRYSTLVNLGRKYCNMPFEVNNNNNEEEMLIKAIISYLSTHKELIYEVNQSSSSPEFMGRSEKSISVQCLEAKEEVEMREKSKEGKFQALEEMCSLEKLEDANAGTKAKIESCPIIEERPVEPVSQSFIGYTQQPVIRFPVSYPFQYQPNSYGFLIAPQLNLNPMLNILPSSQPKQEQPKKQENP